MDIPGERCQRSDDDDDDDGGDGGGGGSNDSARLFSYTLALRVRHGLSCFRIALTPLSPAMTDCAKIRNDFLV